MASTTIRDNVAIGEPNLTTAVSPTSNGSNQNMYSVTNVGAYSSAGDGRVFRFAYDGGVALVPGALYQSPAESTSNYEALAVAANVIGDTVVSVTSSVTVALNALAGGYLTFTQGTGSGNTYSIASNTAATAGTFTITLDDPIRVATASSTLAAAIPNPFYGVVIQPTTATSAPCGVAVVSTAGTQYAWIQTHGAIAVQNDGSGTITPGSQVTFSGSTAGYVCLASKHSGQAIIGTALQTISGTLFGLVQLQID